LGRSYGAMEVLSGAIHKAELWERHQPSKLATISSMHFYGLSVLVSQMVNVMAAQKQAHGGLTTLLV
jgi:hypothetical protein